MAAPSTPHFSANFSPGDLAVLKEYEIITLIYKIKTCRVIFIMLLCIRGYNSLCDPNRHHKRIASYTFKYKLIRMHVSWMINFFNLSDQIWCENDKNENKITWRIWLWMYQEHFVNLSNTFLEINLPWSALKSKQHIVCWIKLIINYLEGGGVLLFTADSWSYFFLMKNMFSTDRMLHLAVLKEYEIIMLKYNGKACRLDLLCFCASKDVTL